MARAAKEVALTRDRARGTLELADPSAEWVDPTEGQVGRPVRVILERIQILDDRDPWLKGVGELRFVARTSSKPAGPGGPGSASSVALPPNGTWKISDEPGSNTVELDTEVFDGFADRFLSVEVAGVEEDTFDPDDRLNTYRRTFTGDPTGWYGSYGPEDVGDWRLWYRIEP